ncbi:hypothetical protein C5E08_13965 [Rathayibacter iranicus]|uniref:Uncharacterized protein n=2 Tax=Rathayibacter iranicus TaxID=59737 RepID=A0AAD1AGY1_9MICO|nr:hypothetical protein C7V51_14210 [Rathayibacter iranicus]PPI42413.1 hypothetical protein C5E09_13065 [Rathayibacter iranicus]PPI57835.1 hypothetical protein C5E08_13965 [Rathayibacter iranicus]PPI68773.1 hypothetical protein C5E01_13020 [Rathayibacter iranicus]PWJ66579.1 hypothetical protein B0H03_10126 [Rathayibacter iranicus NCPPB 2253 = VKM Ac-1602]
MPTLPTLSGTRLERWLFDSRRLNRASLVSLDDDALLRNFGRSPEDDVEPQDLRRGSVACAQSLRRRGWSDDRSFRRGAPDMLRGTSNQPSGRPQGLIRGVDPSEDTQ